MMCRSWQSPEWPTIAAEASIEADFEAVPRAGDCIRVWPRMALCPSPRGQVTSVLLRLREPTSTIGIESQNEAMGPLGDAVVKAVRAVRTVSSRRTRGGRKRVKARGPFEESVMKSGSKLFIFTGVALALVTVLLAIAMTSGGDKRTQAADPKPGKVKVVKAAVDFEPHKIITMSDILVEEMSSDQVPADAATDTASVLGQSYKLGAVKGDILLSTYLEEPGITAGIAPGKRAFSLELDNREMMAGLIMDGDYVDVVFDARVDLRRILQIHGIDFEEDG